MSTLMIIFLTIGISALILFIIGIALQWNEGSCAALFLIMFLVTFLGMFLWGFGDIHHTKNIPIKCRVEHTSKEVIVYTEDNNKYSFNTKEEYDMLNDSTQFYYEVGYDHYNHEGSRSLKYNLYK